MNNLILVKHAPGAPGLRFLGLGAKFIPNKGLNQLKKLLNKNTSWANQRSAKDIKKMLSKSSIIISAWKHKKLIGFGRATSDQIFRAVLWDVVVDKNYQNLGLGRQIVKSILLDRRLKNVEKIYLMTTDHKDFYSKINFKQEKMQTLMVLKKKCLDSKK